MALLAKCHVLPLLLALVLLLSCSDASGKTFKKQGRSNKKRKSKNSLLKQMFCPNMQTHWLMLGFEDRVAFPLPTCPNKDFSELYEGAQSPNSRRLFNVQSAGNNTDTNVSIATTNNSSLTANCSVLSLPSFAEWQNSSTGVCVWSCRSGFYLPDPNISACHGCKAAGYLIFDNTSFCTPCKAGWYKPLNDSSACVKCPPRTFAWSGSSACDFCPDDSAPLSANFSAFECVCKLGYQIDPTNTSCIPCEPGYYKNETAERCSECEINSYASANSSINCTACPLNQGSMAGSISPRNCSCLPGRGYDEATKTCAPCLPGFFKEGRWNDRCVPCPPGTYADKSGLDECVTCPPGSTSPVKSDTINMCECVAGLVPAVPFILCVMK
ncbi:hypothetical protein GUITHDRAFT_132882 [Guillardia theta CCMP2712]|uniref:Tyrosine-protein kinase ephrin type A/B receptor-like domain-containing protein n=1 Tax=Guillardia theta (strain CCMP2712) TaxID=905079 RepID=L1K0F7_GUITC|nr:hypothetical protein GUITHDRAFT_132882 [Guillardia theta CCMP2712]EKX53843.1 hypothetical protein GUITHDRAFT_132882 [Guillardia theta CCMP2712]|eukprot:XP_005840823.1 hypothetical protein GUITHDRAFT_132882 [Guillardia theta CCMP2712]